MVYSREKYERMVNSVTDNDIKVDSDQMTELLNELGIKNSNSELYNLILWNDHVNDMLDVIVALYEVCKLSNDDCVRVMLEAHEKGRALVKTGSLDEMMTMKQGLNDRNLEATVEQN